MIALEDAKVHLRVDHDDEDTLIERMIEAASAAALDYLNVEGFDSNGAPAPVQAAVLLLVGDLYMNRERQADRQLFTSQTYERLLNPYRVMDI